MSFLYSNLRFGRPVLQTFTRRFSAETVKPVVTAATVADEGAKDSWYVLSGFSRSVHRNDLESLLGDIRPTKVDPLLDNRFFASGLYALQMPAAQFEQLRTQLLANFKHKYKLSDDMSEYQRYVKASDLRIDAKTVRVRGYRPQIPKQHLQYIYNKYNLRRHEPVRVIKRHDQPICLLHFHTIHDAEQFVAEKGMDTVEERELVMFHYQA